MTSKTKSKSKKSAAPVFTGDVPEQGPILKALWLALADQDIAYDNRSVISEAALVEERELEIEQVARDLFHGQTLTSYIQGGLEALKRGLVEEKPSPPDLPDPSYSRFQHHDEKPFDLNTFDDEEKQILQNAVDYLLTGKIQVVFSHDENDDDGYGGSVSSLWVSDLSRGWLMQVDGSMGSYCDDNYDANATIKIQTGLTPAQVEELVEQEVVTTVERLTSNFCNTLRNLTSCLPDGVKKMASKIVLGAVTSTTQGHELFAPVLANKEKQEIQSHLDGDLDLGGKKNKSAPKM